ncbi:hypothetical protein [Salipiger abyssi]|uniref:hypothetical protein n=1 Tax=Salipiger abyssi TaxID=1250539 RepID=UPI001A8C8C2D|nr:hypothetical protein [Salipiger abyssi]MBN9889281.1 hypothetical protein [Salipiger abyssi]
MLKDETSMVITGLCSGLTMSIGGAVGTVVSYTTLTGLSGYEIEQKETSDGKSYDALTIVNEPQAEDPPSVKLSLLFTSAVSFGELDLELRYNDIPVETQVQVASSLSALSISRRDISGDSLIGSAATDVDPTDITLDLMLWIPKPGELSRGSEISISLSKIEGGSGGPVKKTLLEKTELTLS